MIRYVAVVLVAASLAATAQESQSNPAPALYFVAATPAQPATPEWYPAALYTTAGQNRLQLVRQIFTAKQYFSDLADDLHGRIYLAAGKGISVIHQDDPARDDFVALSGFDDFPCWGAVLAKNLSPVAQFCDGPDLNRVLGDAVPGKPRVGPGSWANFKYLQYGGENGGPFQMAPPLAEIAGQKLVMPYAFRPEVVLAQLPPQMAAGPKERRIVRIIASTDRYLAIWITPAHMVGVTITTSNLDHAEPLQVLVLDRSTNKWNTLELPTAVSSITNPAVRIFGDWLVTTVMHWKPAPDGTGSGSPGMQNERTTDTPGVPDIRDGYYNQFRDLYIPGELLIQNLADGRKLTLQTGQEDSEVLAIREDGVMLYRVNDSIYSVRITGTEIKERTLIVKDDRVPDIHWAFWQQPPQSVGAK